jgi:hypothetical protein
MPTGRTGVKHDAVIQQTALSATARGSTIRRWVCTEAISPTSPAGCNNSQNDLWHRGARIYQYLYALRSPLLFLPRVFNGRFTDSLKDGNINKTIPLAHVG